MEEHAIVQATLAHMKEKALAATRRALHVRTIVLERGCAWWHLCCAQHLRNLLQKSFKLLDNLVSPSEAGAIDLTLVKLHDQR